MTAAGKPEKKTRKRAAHKAAAAVRPVMSVPRRVAGLTAGKPGPMAALAALAGAAAGWLAHLLVRRRDGRGGR